MTDHGLASDLLSTLPARDGHFLLESGCHTDVWLTLDALFVDPVRVAPLVGALADVMGTRFYFSEPAAAAHAGLFTAEYRIPAGLVGRLRGERLAVVDDVISAGSSARATVCAVDAAGAKTVVVGALMTLGSAGIAYFSAQHLPLETLERRPFHVWPPNECPLCAAGAPLEDAPR